MQLFHLLIVFLVCCFSHLTYSRVLTIIDSTVVKDKFHIVHELFDFGVLVIFQLLLNRAEIHRMLHYVMIVR